MNRLPVEKNEEWELTIDSVKKENEMIKHPEGIVIRHFLF